MAGDVPGSADLAEIERPLGSEIVRYREGVRSAVRFPLQRVERVNNRIEIDNELDLEGHVVDLTYQLGPREDYESYMQGLTDQLNAIDGDILFECESRGCGISGLWANSLFEVRELYGPNGSQIYIAAELPGDEPRYLSAYGIERGNRRQYVHLRLVEPGVEERRFQGLQALQTENRVVLPVAFAGDRVSPESREAIRVIADDLKSLGDRDLAIVSFKAVTPGGTLSDAIAQSQARADHVQTLLREAGLPISEAHGLGALIPVNRRAPERVEIVKYR
jgi:hypothetical protein